MYNLKQQVGEANRHATVACALLAGHAPHTFPDAEPDIPELKARISAAIDFVQALPRAAIDAAADKEVAFTFKNGSPAKIHRQVAAADVQRSAFLLSRHDGRTTSCAMPASIWPRRIFWDRRDNACARFAATFGVSCGQIGGGAASGSSRSSIARSAGVASLSRSSTIWIAASRDIGPVDDRSGILPDGLVDIVVAVVEADRPL
jgi:hypothetical protein